MLSSGSCLQSHNGVIPVTKGLINCRSGKTPEIPSSKMSSKTKYFTCTDSMKTMNKYQLSYELNHMQLY